MPVGADAPAQRRVVLADDPAHPDSDTFGRIHARVRGTGHWNEEEGRNVAAALYRAQAADRVVQRVDAVMGGRGRDGAENVFAVYMPHGEKGPSFFAQVDGRVAAQQPAERSIAQAERLWTQRVQEMRQHERAIAPRVTV